MNASKGDVYLGYGLDGLRDQPFHRENAASFRGYEDWRIVSRCFCMSATPS